MKLEEVYKIQPPADLEIRFAGLYESEVLINGESLEDVERIELVSQWGEHPTLRLKIWALDEKGNPIIYASAVSHIDAAFPFSGVLKGKLEPCEGKTDADC